MVFAAHGAEARRVCRFDFEDVLCGGLPKGLSSASNAVTSNALCRYVTNVDAASGRQSLACDFSHLADGSRVQKGAEHGWLSWWGDPKLTNGWLRWSVCVKRRTGSLKGEIRATVGRRTKPDSRRPMWFAWWLTLDEAFGVRPESPGVKRTEVGKIPYNRWCRLELLLPLPANPTTNAYGRVAVREADGRFAPGPRVAIPMGDLKLLSGYHLMQFGGAGRAFWLLDDLAVEAVHTLK